MLEETRKCGSTESKRSSRLGINKHFRYRLISQSEIYRGISDNYGGTSGKIFGNYRGQYIGEV